MTPSPEPAVDPFFEILYEDDACAAVYKSGNLPCHPSGRYREHTLETLLRKKADFPAVHFVSRLDRETSGVVLVAKHTEAASWYGRAMMRQSFHKEYLCIVRGVWNAAALGLAEAADGWSDVFGWIRPVHDEIVHKSRRFDRADDRAAWEAQKTTSQSALTRIRPLPWEAMIAAPEKKEALQAYSLLHCSPVTGRTHQIRATLAGLGFEVVGDKLYGPDRSMYARLCEDRLTPDDLRRLLLPRQALHAWRLKFPAYEKPMEMRTAEASPDLLLQTFRNALSVQP